MADKRERKSRTRQYASEEEVLTLGSSRQRRMRRIGSTERKPLPVITPRPRREQEEVPPSRAAREKRVAKTTTIPGKPPVMARGGMESMAVRRPKRSAPRRRYDFSLGSLVADAPGAEVRLPALPHLQFSWRILSGGIIIMLVACLYMVWKSPAFRISDVQATGLERLTVADLNSTLGVLGDSVFMLSSNDLEQRLQSMFPELKDVRVKVSIPGTVTISATERQPVLSWTQAQEETDYWVDAEGVAFFPRGNPTTALVRIRANSNPPGAMSVETDASSALPGVVVPSAPQLRLTPELVSTILALNTIAPPDTLLLYSADHGLGWNDKEHGWKVFFGSETLDINQKLLVYQALAAQLESQGVKPEFISVEYLHAPYYKMER
jgi:hypothetical protein